MSKWLTQTVSFSQNFSSLEKPWRLGIAQSQMLCHQRNQVRSLLRLTINPPLGIASQMPGPLYQARYSPFLKFSEKFPLKHQIGSETKFSKVSQNRKSNKIKRFPSCATSSIIEQYFGISHLHDEAKRAQITIVMKNSLDAWFRQAAGNMFRGMKILPKALG